MRYAKLIPALLLTATAACASVATVSPTQPHGLVTLYNTVGVGDIHPVAVASLDGVNMPARRQSFTLAPGTHTLRVVALLNQAHQRSPAMQVPVRPTPPHKYDLVLEVEEGMHYTIAARFDGPTAYDWKPVVLRSEPLTR